MSKITTYSGRLVRRPSVDPARENRCTLHLGDLERPLVQELEPALNNLFVQVNYCIFDLSHKLETPKISTLGVVTGTGQVSYESCYEDETHLFTTETLLVGDNDLLATLERAAEDEKHLSLKIELLEPVSYESLCQTAAARCLLRGMRETAWQFKSVHEHLLRHGQPPGAVLSALAASSPHAFIDDTALVFILEELSKLTDQPTTEGDTPCKTP
jgi:hypothetical protein